MKKHLIAFAVMALAAGGALAQANDTIAKVKGSGVVTMGVRDSSGALSFTLGDGKYAGFHYDLCQRIIANLEKAAGKKLEIKYLPVTSQNRIPLVQNGSVDLECGSTTHNRERARQVAFSVSIFQTSSRLLTRMDSGVTDLSDLGGRRVLVTAGTTSERQLMLHSESTGLKVDIVSAKDHGEAFEQLQSGRAVAFLMDEALLYGLRAKTDRPEDWRVVGKPMATEVYACMLRKDDAAFKAVVDRSLTRLMQSGEALKVYRRWFQSPIPPKGLNLNWPPPDALLDLYRSPTDQPLG